jgi:hypothetical protein
MSHVLSVALAFGCVACAPLALGATLGFQNLERVPNNYASQLSLQILEAGEGKVLFALRNLGAVPGRIQRIAVQDLGGHLQAPQIVHSTGVVRFKAGTEAKPPVTPPFIEEFGFTFEGD